MVVMLQIESKHAKRLRFPAASRRLEAEAGRVDNRDDRHWHAAVRKIDAASATVVLDEDAKEILVLDLLGVASGLETSHHELILLGDRLHHSVLLLLLGDFVTDVIEVELHVGEPFALARVRTLDGLVHEALSVSMRMVTCFDSQPLLNVEADTVSSDLAVGVVDVDLASADLGRHELILLEHAPHRGSALVTAAPGLDLARLLLLLTDLEGDGLLTDD